MRPPPLTAPRNEGVHTTTTTPPGSLHRRLQINRREPQLLLVPTPAIPVTINVCNDLNTKKAKKNNFEQQCNIKIKKTEINTSSNHASSDSSNSSINQCYFEPLVRSDSQRKNITINKYEEDDTVLSIPVLETEPLLTGTVQAEQSVPKPSPRTIYLNKNNSISLIFTKKDLSPEQIEFRNKIPESTTSANLVNEKVGLSGNCRNRQNRRSLQLTYPPAVHSVTTTNNSNRSGTTAANNRKQLSYSWYAPVYSALEEELEQDSRESSPIHNLANQKKTSEKIYSDNETISLLETKNNLNIQPHNQNNQSSSTSRLRKTPTSTLANLSLTSSNTIYSSNNSGSGNSSANVTPQIPLHHQNDTEGPHATSLLAGGPLPRRKRFENFIKSLVGRKTASRDTNSPATATTKDSTTNPPILPSPEITINCAPSNNNVVQDPTGGALSSFLASGMSQNYEQHEKYILGNSCSTTSLNAVQQKLWNVVPLLRREGCGGSAANLSNDKPSSLGRGLRKCETVVALSRHSSMVSANKTSVEQIQPLNRLRNSISTSNATCSRCSSLLSLAASGSRYSLNIASNSEFVKEINNSNKSNNNNSDINGINNIVIAHNDGNNCKILTSSPRSTCFYDNTDGHKEDVASVSPLSLSSSSSISKNHLSLNNMEAITCKLCLVDVTGDEATIIKNCGCTFCTECMKAYVEFEISEGAYEISCPDAQCPSQGCISLDEISNLTSNNLMNKHHRYRLNREIELDKNRTWCPRAGCETICQVGSSFATTSKSADDKENTITQILCAVQCPTCKEEFCSGCKKPWHPNISCDENNRRLAAEGQDDIGIPFDNELIKCCPMCAVPIEKDEGCAQMMCKRCKHVFCWYCLASLDDDFLLRHYDKGPCKNKLGHSRASVVWHRAQVIGIFAGFGILLLVASPLLLLAAPCIICCKCRICTGSNKLDEPDGEFDEGTALQR